MASEEGASGSSDWNPMRDDFLADVGFTQQDPVLASEGVAIREGGINTVPCKFHDGFSGTCWKGSSCPYGHEKYTGGLFTTKYPDAPALAFAASSRQAATLVTRLPNKPIFCNEQEVRCRVTFTKNPSEFYIVPTPAGKICPSHLLDRKIREMLNKKEPEDPMDAYYHGFTALEPVEDQGTAPPPPLAPPSMEQKLTAHLNTAFNYKKMQYSSYCPKSELVAVKNTEGKWNRAFVQALVDKDSGMVDRPSVYARLVDTGERIVAPLKDVCRLPEKFCNEPAAAYRCSLFGISPTFHIWARKAVKMFQEMVANREVLVIIKDGPGSNPEIHGSTYLFESTPYVVKILIDELGTGDKWIDVADQISATGYGLPWNLIPFRPFAREVMDLTFLEFLHTPHPEPLPPSALKRENERMENLKEFFENEAEGEAVIREAKQGPMGDPTPKPQQKFDQLEGEKDRDQKGAVVPGEIPSAPPRLPAAAQEGYSGSSGWSVESESHDATKRGRIAHWVETKKVCGKVAYVRELPPEGLRKPGKKGTGGKTGRGD